MYGWRGRVGMVFPSRGDTFTYEFYQAVPEGVVLVSTALDVQNLVTEELEMVLRRYDEAVDRLVYEEVDCLFIGGTPPIILGGPGSDQKLIERFRERARGIPVTTVTTAEIEAMRKMGMRKIALATPYTDDHTERLKGYLEWAGFEVAAAKGLGVRKNIEIAKLPIHASYRAAKEVFLQAPDVDGVHITCPRWATTVNIPILEEDLGVPVTSSGQAKIWKALDMLRIRDRIEGWGGLLESLSAD